MRSCKTTHHLSRRGCTESSTCSRATYRMRGTGTGVRREPFRVRARFGRRSRRCARRQSRKRDNADPMSARVAEQVVLGVSTQGYKRSLEPADESIEARGASKSNASRALIDATTEKLAQFVSRSLADLDLIAMFIDGIEFAGHSVWGGSATGHRRGHGARLLVRDQQHHERPDRRRSCVDARDRSGGLLGSRDRRECDLLDRPRRRHGHEARKVTLHSRRLPRQIRAEPRRLQGEDVEVFHNWIAACHGESSDSRRAPTR
jgi:hypothetical protein